jgi:hypothetical protein
MASNPSQNNAFELITTGEKTGTWGVITNVNLNIIDRATKGVGTITLSGTTYSLDTIDYTTSEGQYLVLVFAGSPSGTCTVTINPNDQQKFFVVRNTTAQSVILTQGSGGNVTIATGKSAIVYASGAGSGATVVDVTALFNVLQPANNLSDVASAATARTNLGLAIGTNVQAYDAELTAIAALAVTDSNFIVGNGTTWVAESGATARTSLGLGSIATQSAASVTITGGSISGITDLAVADGGTGASDAATARTNLGLAIGTNVQAYDAGLQSISGLTTSANQLIYTTGSDTYATSTLTAFGRSLVDDADAVAARTTLGLVIGTDVLAFDSNLQSFVTAFTLPTVDGSNGQVLTTNGTGTLSFATPSTYNDASVDAHLNTATATASEVLSWTGSDYDWVARGATGLDGLSDALRTGTTIGIGVGALQSFTTDGANVALGNSALQDGTGAFFTSNTAVGHEAMQNATSAFETTVVGARALGSGVYTGNTSVFVGANAGLNATSANSTVAVGHDSLRSVTTGNSNVAVGRDALTSITTGSNNVGLGYATLGGISTGSNSVAVGYAAGTGSTASSSTIVGASAGAFITGTENVAIGFQALDASGQTGQRNVAVGANALGAATSGANNVAIGQSAGLTLTTGSNNVVIGDAAAATAVGVSNEITIGNSSHKVLRLPWTSTVAGLPSASTVGAGARSFVTDANATTFASVVAGGGSNGVPVYSDGTNWRIG